MQEHPASGRTMPMGAFVPIGGTMFKKHFYKILGGAAAGFLGAMHMKGTAWAAMALIIVLLACLAGMAALKLWRMIGGK